MHLFFHPIYDKHSLKNVHTAMILISAEDVFKITGIHLSTCPCSDVDPVVVNTPEPVQFL